ncbi:hypothetical protein HZ326_17526 [Fusarium oxysporum f. sp. albedinis]|nr:hypothetical protein HZ326_17526 [Fusarium oxysporum f. sp. albedinis]
MELKLGELLNRHLQIIRVLSQGDTRDEVDRLGERIWGSHVNGPSNDSEPHGRWQKCSYGLYEFPGFLSSV